MKQILARLLTNRWQLAVFLLTSIAAGSFIVQWYQQPQPHWAVSTAYDAAIVLALLCLSASYFCQRRHIISTFPPESGEWKKRDMPVWYRHSDREETER